MLVVYVIIEIKNFKEIIGDTLWRFGFFHNAYVCAEATASEATLDRYLIRRNRGRATVVSCDRNPLENK